MTEQKNVKNLFGVTDEEIEKSKDILPTFDIGKLESDTQVFGTVICDEPKLVETEDKFSTEDPKPKIKTPVIKVLIEKVIKKSEKEENGILVIPFDEKFTLWLSSKSLSLDFATIFKDCEEKEEKNFNGTNFKISIGKAVYKKYGENRVYNVSEILKEVSE